ncbi:ParB N-terminal domain-containing protein [Peribacillus simplex]|uniref:ParB/RepB/Spo0J family partition protein n=1 Tax=Peribacillus simplex TaxID=1478 RepID=UPI00298E77E7|nr:ParB N-terminal domain-containing protein [Peribacillus simplex]MDW7616983.1 ParB N-terminal domain-containing protein [Peribacillus simplex]
MDKIQVNKIHVAHYQVWAEMTGETFEQLVADIKRSGVTYPIIIDETFTVLDGHHRLKATKQAGLEFIDCIVRAGLSEEEKIELAYKENATRRTISTKEKVERAIQLRAERRSFRQIATWLGVGKSTVERWIRKNEQGVPPGTSNSRIKGSDGKEYPPKQPKREGKQTYVDGLCQKVSDLEAEIYKLKEDKRRLTAANLAKEKEIKALQKELQTERLFKSYGNSWDDNGLKVFAVMVGLQEDSTPAEISKAFRKAKGKAHPDTGGNEWISQRYNVSSDLFEKIYKTG